MSVTRQQLQTILLEVNAHGGFGTWAWDVVVGDAAGMQDAVARHE